TVTSIGGRITMGAHGCYTATKFALEALSEALAQEVKAFNIRVAIVEPGIMKTAIFDEMPESPRASRYPHEARLRALHAAALRNAVSPFVAGQAIRHIVESATTLSGWPGCLAVPGEASRYDRRCVAQLEQPCERRRMVRATRAGLWAGRPVVSPGPIGCARRLTRAWAHARSFRTTNAL